MPVVGTIISEIALEVQGFGVGYAGLLGFGPAAGAFGATGAIVGGAVAGGCTGWNRYLLQFNR